MRMKHLGMASLACVQSFRSALAQNASSKATAPSTPLWVAR